MAAQLTKYFFNAANAIPACIIIDCIKYRLDYCKRLH